MRTAVASFTGFFVILLLTAILCTIISHTAYKDTVQQNLDDSIEFAVQMLQTDMDVADISTKVLDEGSYNTEMAKTLVSNMYGSVNDNLTSDEILKKNFVTLLVNNLHANVTKLDINIYGADAEKGVLSVEVTAWYKFLTGTDAKVTSYKTVILDKYHRNIE